MDPPINHITRIHHDNRPVGITRYTFRLIPLKDHGHSASVTGNTEAWPKFATVQRSPTARITPSRPQRRHRGGRELIEPRSRAEYSADLERHVALVTFKPRRAGLPDVSIKDATEYLSDGSNEAFLRRLWRDLYGDEP